MRSRVPRPSGDGVAAMSGVANAVVPARQFDTPLTYEAMCAIGSGLCTAGFILFDDRSDLPAVAAEVSRFLAVESCGQCSPCESDGLTIAAHLDRLGGPDGGPTDLETIDESTVAGRTTHSPALRPRSGNRRSARHAACPSGRQTRGPAIGLRHLDQAMTLVHVGGHAASQR